MQDFRRLLAETLDMPLDAVPPDAEFRNLDKWDSVAALALVVMVEDTYGATLTSDDIASSTTVADLARVVLGKAKR